MVGALIVVVFVGVGESRDPSTDAMVRAARDALGGDASVDVREQDAAPNDAEVVALERAPRPPLIADVRWADASRTRAHVRLHLRDAGRWIERDIGFGPLDASAERGRALGFTLASMVPSPHAQARPPEPPPSDARPLERPAAVAIVSPPSPPQVLSAPAPRPRPFALYMAGAASTGIEGVAGALGGTIAGERHVGALVAVRIGASVRTGEVAAAQATSLVAAGGVGVKVIFVPATNGRSFGLAVRADALVQWQSVAHFSSDDPTPIRQSRALPAADALGEASFAMSDTASIVLASGLEVATGTTEIYLHRARVAVVPPLRGVFEVGLSVRF